MNSREQYLLMKHLFRLERAYIDLDSNIPCRSQVILKWTNNSLIRDGGHLIPDGSILITEANRHVLKEAIDRIENIILDHIRDTMVSVFVVGKARYIKNGRYSINPSYLRREFYDLYKTVSETTLEAWPSKRPDRNDSLLDRWNYKRCFEAHGLLVRPEELIKNHLDKSKRGIK